MWDEMKRCLEQMFNLLGMSEVIYVSVFNLTLEFLKNNSTL